MSSVRSRDHIHKNHWEVVRHCEPRETSLETRALIEITDQIQKREKEILLSNPEILLRNLIASLYGSKTLRRVITFNLHNLKGLDDRAGKNLTI